MPGWVVKSIVSPSTVVIERMLSGCSSTKVVNIDLLKVDPVQSDSSLDTDCDVPVCETTPLAAMIAMLEMWQLSLLDLVTMIVRTMNLNRGGSRVFPRGFHFCSIPIDKYPKSAILHIIYDSQT